ncbi:DUF397 domain-containing protein [Actinomadura adrarensis]|uniref:DUF397 domain-containing protein n=1 Tax=Actinomadura adrarensis TaxID=1819600 RepID=A0ABW3CKW3_9ACTN
MSEHSSHPEWRTSSHSTGQGTECVQVAALSANWAIATRDSKDPDGGVLKFSAHEWTAFLAGVKAGRFDRV